MTEKEPMAELMVESEGAVVTPWTTVTTLIADPGPTATPVLASVRPDGRPHAVPLWPTWNNGAFFLATNQGTRMRKNLAQNPNCVIVVALKGFDLVVEGEARHTTDSATLERLAEVFNGHGWPVTVTDGSFEAPFGPLTKETASYELWEVTPAVAFGIPTDESGNHPTRYRF
ncbi:MAG: pyridoxamine 5'-phosphate oxidase family protein [Thermomicrobiales bacterium]